MEKRTWTTLNETLSGPLPYLDTYLSEQKAQLRAATKLRLGGVKPRTEIFGHIALTTVRRYKVPFNKTKRSETTRLHHARLKHEELLRWVDTEGSSTIQSSAQQDVEESWLPLAQRIHKYTKPNEDKDVPQIEKQMTRK